jgi:putative heme iron utilization protein
LSEGGVTDRPKDVLRATDAEAIRLAKTLLRASRHGALAAIDSNDGSPIASRVGVATDTDGSPLILVSGLAAHTAAIVADPRCSLLLGDPGKGDPLAHPRITLACKAIRYTRDTGDWAQAERRYLNKNPEAKLYVGLGDFAFFRLEIEKASLNGGFGKAYALTRDDLLSAGPAEEFARSEQSAVDHMNGDHADAIANYAMHFGGEDNGDWRMTGYDADGMDLAQGDRVLRIFFPEPLTAPRDAHMKMVEMAKQARVALGDRAAKSDRAHSHS